jgi:hypothetical protein
MQTVQAIQRFEQTRTLTAEGDVNTIRPWMTIPYISRVYHVPETFLYESLNIKDAQTAHHTSLRSLAIRYNRPLNKFISDVQTAITTFREQHPPQHSSDIRHVNELPGRERRKT